MGQNSKIEWTHHTFNPWWGCVKVSPGCAHCYAETFAKRTGHAVWGAESSRRFFGQSHWNEPKKWNESAKARGQRERVFCASMADVFEDREDLRDERRRLLELIDDTPWLDWLLLTKRPQNIARLMDDAMNGNFDRLRTFRDHMPNVWLGTTVEDQERADERIPWLLQIKARVRFLSCEPLLGPFDFQADVWNNWFGMPGANARWVIAGGESGPKARPMHPEWVRAIRNQCTAAGMPFLFKQWGEFEPATLQVCESPMRFVEIDGTDSTNWTLDRHGPSTAMMSRTGKAAAGRVLDGREWSEFPNQQLAIA